MKTIKMIVEIPVAINDSLLDKARENRRSGKGARTKEALINEILRDNFVNNNNKS